MGGVGREGDGMMIWMGRGGGGSLVWRMESDQRGMVEARGAFKRVTSCVTNGIN